MPDFSTLKHSIGTKLLAYILVFTTLVTLTATSLQLYRQYKNDAALLHKQIETIRQSNLADLTHNLWITDYQQIQIMLDAIFLLPDMQYVAVRTPEAKVLAFKGMPQSANVISRQFLLRYVYNGQQHDLGTLEIVASLRGAQNKIRETVFLLLLEEGVKALLVSAFILFIFHFLVTRHLNRMAQYVRTFDIRQPEAPLRLSRTPLPPGARDEMEEMAVAFNEMSAHLQDTYARLSEANSKLERDNEQRRQAEEKAKTAELAWERTFDAITDIATIQDENLQIRRLNRAACETFNGSPEDLVGRFCYEMFRGSSEPCEGCPGLQAIFYGKGHTAEIEHCNLGKTFLVSTSPIFDERGGLSGLVHIAKDITEQKRMKDQLLQAQKMESVGRLAGGIAHDFNNIITAVLGYCDIALQQIESDHPLYRYLTIIRDSGDRAAALTRQLLAFSRKQPLKMTVLNLNGIVENLTLLLARIIKEDIKLEIHADPACRNIEADSGQIEQILMNLSVNAKDAMPQGGRLRISTGNVEVAEETALDHGGVQPGSYVLLSVVDSGSGMSLAVQEKIFEPFFTTKAAGQGTGLGLATVYGIVRQHNGFIAVDSEMGKGTAFHLYFPVSRKDLKALQEKTREASGQGTETVMVIEDDSIIRDLIADSLQPLGYEVFGANTGEEALKISSDFNGVINLFLIDMVMPGMNGSETAVHLAQKRPEAKVIFMSGYADVIISHYEDHGQDVHFLQKPLMLHKLAHKIREVLAS